MNFLTRFFKSRPDLKEGFEDSNNKEHFAAIIQPLFSEVGIVFTLNETYQIESNNDLMNLATAPDFLIISAHFLVSDWITLLYCNPSPKVGKAPSYTDRLKNSRLKFTNMRRDPLN